MQKEYQAKQYADFITVTCLEWRPLLEEDRFKNIVIESLAFLSKANKVNVFAFVIMSNHFHLIWQMLGDHRRGDVQRDFLKYTGQQILKLLRNEESIVLKDLHVQSKDRKYQVWERNSLSIPLWSGPVIDQKLEYIHYNPVKAGLCQYPWQYVYSSAGFYYKSDKRWSFLIHCDG
jgi:putative transposase